MSKVHFGPRVQGTKNYEAEAKAQERGESHFGVRVTGARAGADDPDARARAASEFGPLVTMDAERSDHLGKGGDVEVEELENILTENPTHFRSLYENELSRPGGPRKAALEVFDLVEMGPKGEGRAHVHNEIKTLLGEHDPRSTQKLAEQDALREISEEREKRNKENLLLVDAPRLRALRERENDLKEVQKSESSRSGSKQSADALDSSDQNSEVTRRAAAATGSQEGGSEREGKATSQKSATDTKPETQARTPRASQRPARKQAKAKKGK